MEKGQRVKIINTNSIWDNKEGVLEEVNGEKCTVFVDFIPEQNKRVRQDFNIDNVESLDSFEEAMKDKVSGQIGELEKDFKNGYGLLKTKDGSKFQVAIDDLEEVPDESNEDLTNTILTPKFEEDLIELDDLGRGDEIKWFFEDDGSYYMLQNDGFDKTKNYGRIEQETRSNNNSFTNPNNVTVYALKKGKGSGNQFRAYFYRDRNGNCIFVRGHIKKGYENGPKEYKCIQDTINYANSKLGIDKNK